LHHIADVAFVVGDVVGLYSVDFEDPSELQVLRQLASGDEVEHGSLAAARWSEYGCEGIGGELA
jgi:hypothetical protein